MHSSSPGRAGSAAAARTTDMSPAKQAAIAGFFAIAIVLMVVSFFRTFYSGPKPAPPEAGFAIRDSNMRMLEANRARRQAQGAGTGQGQSMPPAPAGNPGH